MRWAMGMALAAAAAQGQIGTGWVEYTPARNIHLDDAAGLQTFPWSPSQSVGGADYNYDAATGIHTFRILDSRSNRSEVRVQNNYTSGRQQFQGEVRISNPIDGQSVMQVFGGATNATALQIRGFNAGSGTLRRYDSEVLATGGFGAWIRVNVLHDADANHLTVYMNGQEKGRFPDRGNATHYFKFGAYGTLRTPSVKTEWRQVRFFRYSPGTAILPRPGREKQGRGMLRPGFFLDAAGAPDGFRAFDLAGKSLPALPVSGGVAALRPE